MNVAAACCTQFFLFNIYQMIRKFLAVEFSKFALTCGTGRRAEIVPMCGEIQELKEIWCFFYFCFASEGSRINLDFYGHFSYRVSGLC